MDIPLPVLKLACLALQSSLPDITPQRLNTALDLGYEEAVERVELITIKEASQILGCCRETISRMLRRGQLTRYPFGRGRNIRVNRFELFQ